MDWGGFGESVFSESDISLERDALETEVSEVLT